MEAGRLNESEDGYLKRLSASTHARDPIRDGASPFGMYTPGIPESLVLGTGHRARGHAKQRLRSADMYNSARSGPAIVPGGTLNRDCVEVPTCTTAREWTGHRARGHAKYRDCSVVPTCTTVFRSSSQLPRSTHTCRDGSTSSPLPITNRPSGLLSADFTRFTPTITRIIVGRA